LGKNRVCGGELVGSEEKVLRRRRVGGPQTGAREVPRMGGSKILRSPQKAKKKKTKLVPQKPDEVFGGTKVQQKQTPKGEGVLAWKEKTN